MPHATSGVGHVSIKRQRPSTDIQPCRLNRDVPIGAVRFSAEDNNNAVKVRTERPLQVSTLQAFPDPDLGSWPCTRTGTPTLSLAP